MSSCALSAVDVVNTNESLVLWTTSVEEKRKWIIWNELKCSVNTLLIFIKNNWLLPSFARYDFFIMQMTVTIIDMVAAKIFVASYIYLPV